MICSAVSSSSSTTIGSASVDAGAAGALVEASSGVEDACFGGSRSSFGVAGTDWIASCERGGEILPTNNE